MIHCRYVVLMDPILLGSRMTNAFRIVRIISDWRLYKMPQLSKPYFNNGLLFVLFFILDFFS